MTWLIFNKIFWKTHQVSKIWCSSYSWSWFYRNSLLISHRLLISHLSTTISPNIKYLKKNVVSAQLGSILTILALTPFHADAPLLPINLHPWLPRPPTDFYATAITNAVKMVFDKLTLTRTSTTSVYNKPWVIADIRELIKHRESLFTISSRYKSVLSVAVYRRKRHKDCYRLSRAKNHYQDTNFRCAFCWKNVENSPNLASTLKIQIPTLGNFPLITLRPICFHL